MDNLEVIKKIRNRHMIHGYRYVEDLEHTVRQLEKGLKEINEKCVHYDRSGRALKPDEIGEIVMRTLDV